MEARGVKEMAQQVRSAPNTIMRTGGQIPVLMLQVEHSTHSGVDSGSKERERQEDPQGCLTVRFYFTPASY